MTLSANIPAHRSANAHHLRKHSLRGAKPMRHDSRLRLTITSTLLLLFLTACLNPAATPTLVPDTVTPLPRTVTPVPPSATPAPPTQTPVPPTATPVPTTGKVEGRVFRSDTNEPIEDAIVALHDAALDKDIADATADAQGYYAFADVKPGAYS